MANVVRNPYSNVAGNTPSSLGNGQIGVNQADGRIFFRNSAGAVATFSSIASFATTASFPATGASSSVLYLASDTSKLYQWNGVYVEIGVAGGGGGGGPTTDASLLTSGTLDDARLSATVTTALTNARTPTAHASSHASGGADAISIAASQVSGLATVATSGSYADLSNKPTIPAATTSDDDQNILANQIFG